MSRGPGKWQRLILAELAKREAFYLGALAGRPRDVAAYKQLNRAAVKLEKAGAIRVVHGLHGGHPRGLGGIIIHRLDVTVNEDEDQWNWLNWRKNFDDVRWRDGEGALHVAIGGLYPYLPKWG